MPLRKLKSYIRKSWHFHILLHYSDTLYNSQQPKSVVLVLIIMTKPENMYEIPSHPVDRGELEKWQRKIITRITIGFIFLTIFVAAAIGISIYSATREIKVESTMTQTAPNASGSACSRIKCDNQGTCVNIYPDNYICVCVATFYGRKCQHGEFSFSLKIYTIFFCGSAEIFSYIWPFLGDHFIFQFLYFRVEGHSIFCRSGWESILYWWSSCYCLERCKI